MLIQELFSKLNFMEFSEVSHKCVQFLGNKKETVLD